MHSRDEEPFINQHPYPRPPIVDKTPMRDESTLPRHSWHLTNDVTRSIEDQRGGETRTSPVSKRQRTAIQNPSVETVTNRNTDNITRCHTEPGMAVGVTSQEVNRISHPFRTSTPATGARALVNGNPVLSSSFEGWKPDFIRSSSAVPPSIEKNHAKQSEHALHDRNSSSQDVRYPGEAVKPPTVAPIHRALGATETFHNVLNRSNTMNPQHSVPEGLSTVSGIMDVSQWLVRYNEPAVLRTPRGVGTPLSLQMHPIPEWKPQREIPTLTTTLGAGSPLLAGHTQTDVTDTSLRRAGDSFHMQRNGQAMAQWGDPMNGASIVPVRSSMTGLQQTAPSPISADPVAGAREIMVPQRVSHPLTTTGNVPSNSAISGSTSWQDNHPQRGTHMATTDRTHASSQHATSIVPANVDRMDASNAKRSRALVSAVVEGNPGTHGESLENERHATTRATTSGRERGQWEDRVAPFADYLGHMHANRRSPHLFGGPR